MKIIIFISALTLGSCTLSQSNSTTVITNGDCVTTTTTSSGTFANYVIEETVCKTVTK